jgi:hypothetical protein
VCPAYLSREFQYFLIVHLYLCFVKHHDVNRYWGEEVKLHAFLNFSTRWICVISGTLLLLYPYEKFFGTNFSHYLRDRYKNLNPIAFWVQTVLSNTPKTFKDINIVDGCSLIMQTCCKKCTYRIRQVDVTSCEDKSRDNISMPSRRRQMQGIASILQQGSNMFSIQQLREVHRNYTRFQASSAKRLGTAPFWFIARQVVAISY